MYPTDIRNKYKTKTSHARKKTCHSIDFIAKSVHVFTGHTSTGTIKHSYVRNVCPDSQEKSNDEIQKKNPK